MGFFSAIINGLKKTKAAIGHKINQVFKRGVYDDSFFEELEEILLTADVGIAATENIIETLRERLDEEKISDPEKATEILKDIMTELVDCEPFDYTTPAVILVTGVNGVGKTTTIGKLASIMKKKAKALRWRRRTPSERPRAISLRSGLRGQV